MDRATFDFYQNRAPYYTASGAQGPSRDLDPFLARLSPNARILELGCGGGRDAAHMIARGFDVDATDGVPAMARKANERHDVGARVMRFDELDAEAAYDAVWAYACLLHCPCGALPSVLARIHRALRPSGLHFGSYKLGTGEGRDLLGRLHNFPTFDWLCEQYVEAGFALVETEIYAGRACDGTQRDWAAITAEKQ
jgi:SAM-dependent methyltransferase